MDAFAGRSAIVTGAASGIGKALAQELSRRGARVLVTDLDGAQAEEVARGLAADGYEARGAALDVTDPARFAAVVQAEAESHGRLDFLFNNAGVGLVGEVRDLALDDWRRTIEVDLMGVVNGVHAAYPLMTRQRSGHIVNTASLAGLVSAPGLAAYTAAKHGVVGLSLSLRAEGAALGVRVSVLCPGLIRTGIIQSTRYVGLDASRVRQMLPGRMGTPLTCAREALAGVARNRGIITVGADASLVWRLFRLYPTAFEPWTRRLAQQLRLARR